MVNWPDSLVIELAERRCIIFLGAGASAGSLSPNGLRPPNWETLLRKALDLLHNQDDKAEAERLINKEQFLDAAQVIFENSNAADRTHFFRTTFLHPNYQASEIHKIVNELDPKIVITTNYDEIYEKYCFQGQGGNGYSVCRYYQDYALNDIRSDIRLILKAHGCITDITKLVLSRASYFEARRSYSSFYAILDSLFLTHTLLFIGASLTDPDIQLVLENVNIAVPSVHTHYALVESGRHPAIKQAILNNYNIQLLEYAAGQHQEAVDALIELNKLVQSYRYTRGTI